MCTFGITNVRTKTSCNRRPAFERSLKEIYSLGDRCEEFNLFTRANPGT